MLRSTFVAIRDYLSVTGRSSAGGHIRRGTLKCEFDADIAVDHADGERVGTILGVDVRRNAALSDGQMQYLDEDGTEICKNY